MLAEHGVSLSAEGYAIQISGRSNAEIVARLLPTLAEQRARQVWEEKEALFRQQAKDLATPPGLRSFIEKAVVEGAKLGVVTNAPRANAEHVLAALGLSDYFACIVAVEDVQAPKPNPEPYFVGMRRLGLSAERCVAFEDSPSGVKSAAAAGLCVVGLLTGHTEQQLTDAGAVLVVSDFHDPRVQGHVSGVRP